MIKISERPILDQEKEKLQNMIPGFWKRIEGFIIKFLLIFMISMLPLLFIGEILNTPFFNKGWFAFLWSLVSILIALLLTWREEKSRSVIIKELEEGLVKQINCQANQVYMMEISGSLGIVYIFPCSANQTLIFNDQLLEIFEQAPDTFPNTNFELALSPTSQYVLDIQINGEFLIPKIGTLKIPSLQKSIKENHYLMIEQPLSDIIDIQSEDE